MSESENEKKLRDDAVDKALRDLGEHFDAVQILGTLHVGDDTLAVKRGAGNWHSRIGLAHEFIEQSAAEDQAEYIAHKLNEEGGA